MIEYTESQSLQANPQTPPALVKRPSYYNIILLLLLASPVLSLAYRHGLGVSQQSWLAAGIARTEGAL